MDEEAVDEGGAPGGSGGSDTDGSPDVRDGTSRSGQGREREPTLAAPDPASPRPDAQKPDTRTPDSQARSARVQSEPEPGEPAPGAQAAAAQRPVPPAPAAPRSVPPAPAAERTVPPAGAAERTVPHGTTPAAVRTGAGVRAVDFGLKGPRGQVFSGVRCDAPPGSLIAVEGPSGSGRTCLLLALTGRMRATEGRAVVDGRRLPGQLAAVRRISAPAAVPGVTDLEPSHTVAEQLREQALLQSRFGAPLRELCRPRAERAAARARTAAALSAAGLDVDTLPKGPRTRVRDLGRLERLRLCVALALLGEPRLLAVDDADLGLREHEREQAWALLRSVASSGVTVLAVCSEAPPGAVTVRTGTRRCRQRPEAAGQFAATSSEEEADALAQAGRA